MKTRIPIAETVAAVMAISSFGMNTALAAPPVAKLPTAQSDAQVIQVASKKKHRRAHRNNAAGAAAVMGLFGVIGAIAAQDAYRDRYYYDDGYYYRGRGRVYHNPPRYRGRSHGHYRGPAYRGPSPGYYSPGGIPRGNADPYGR